MSYLNVCEHAVENKEEIIMKETILKKKSISNSKKIIEKRSRKNKTDIRTGKWDGDEHERFIEAMKKYGNSWKHAEMYIGTRTANQIRSHAQKYYLKLRKEKLEQMLQDPELKNAVFVICKEYFNHATTPISGSVLVSKISPNNQASPPVLPPMQPEPPSIIQPNLPFHFPFLFFPYMATPQNSVEQSSSSFQSQAQSLFFLAQPTIQPISQSASIPKPTQN